MRQFFVPFLVGLFLWFSMDVWGKQASATPASADSEHQAIQSNGAARVPDCGSSVDALRSARQAVERDQQVLSTATDSSSAMTMGKDEFPPGNLKQDLMVLEQREAELNQCVASANQAGVTPDLPNGCSSEQLLNFQVSHHDEQVSQIPIWHLPGSPVFFYKSGMTIDADGAPNAYHPDNTGLDDLKNAGSPGNWEGLAKDGDGEPFVQGPNDPFPGYYVSETALADRSRPVNDPMRYVDASKVPFIVLPGAMAREVGARPGDFAEVLNLGNGKSSYAIFGDVGPSDRIGEGSVALAESLGIRSDARNGGARRGILYLVFPGSGNGQPRTVDEINTETEKLVQAWGGISQLTFCTAQQGSPQFEGVRNTY